MVFQNSHFVNISQKTEWFARDGLWVCFLFFFSDKKTLISCCNARNFKIWTNCSITTSQGFLLQASDLLEVTENFHEISVSSLQAELWRDVNLPFTILLPSLIISSGFHKSHILMLVSQLYKNPFYSPKPPEHRLQSSKKTLDILP